MRRSESTVPLLVVLALLLSLLYPALVLDARVAPEAGLRSVPPWRLQSGPYPKPSPSAMAAATGLGPRLASIQRDGLAAALWNPWIGGGRPGWLSAPEEGGAPLAVLAGLAARAGWNWTALHALEIGLGFAVAFWLSRRLGLRPWSAAVTGVTYALSGAVIEHWLDWQGTAFVLGPLALVAVLSPQRRRRQTVAAWGAISVLLILSGSPVAPFVAAAAGLAALSPTVLGRRQRWGAVALGITVGALAAMPSLWLDRAGGEAGAPAPALTPGPPLTQWNAWFATPADDQMMDEATDAAAAPQRAAYVGAVAGVLALLGIGGMPVRMRGFWVAVLGVSLVLDALPTALLVRVGAHQRPFGMAALAVAVCAGYGTETLWRRLSPPVLADTIAALLCAAVLITLAPAAAKRIPFATGDDAELASPVPPRTGALDARTAAVLATLPPDTGAIFGLADVRAASFRREPRYASLLGAGPSGSLSVSRALSPALARLGDRWLLEPQPLHVVSGEIFARIEQIELHANEDRPRDGLRRFQANLPADACRVGAAASSVADGGVWLERPGRHVQLEPDPALATESEAWRWYAIPRGWPAGDVEVAFRDNPAITRAVVVAWDNSRLRLSHEDQGVRIWEWDGAVPIAFLARGIQSENDTLPEDPRICTLPAGRVASVRARVSLPSSGSVTAGRLTPVEMEFATNTAAPALLAIQVKYRPALWRAEVNSVAVHAERLGGVWTGVEIPAGRSRVVLRARLPRGLILLSAGSVAALAVLAMSRRT